MSVQDAALRALVAAEVRAQVAAVTGLSSVPMLVDSLQDDGTVNLVYGEQVITGVVADTGYRGRAAGDVVRVLRSPSGWYVMGKAGPEPAAGAKVVVPPETRVSSGSTAPVGSGWDNGSAWARVNADGTKDLYVQTPTPTPPPVRVPGSVTLSPSSQGAWRDGHLDASQTPTQGTWYTYPHPYTGAWCYGSQVTAACAGRTVGAMTLHLSRIKGTNGIDGTVRPVIYLHNYSSAPVTTPSLGDGPMNGPSLGKGSSGTFAVPAAWRTALATGTAHGFAVQAGVGTQYLIFTGGCGALDIDFI